MNFRKYNRHIKSISLIALLTLSFIGAIAPKVFAVNPTITYITTNFCAGSGGTACGTTFNLFGTLVNPNPSTIIGQGLITAIWCTPSGTNQSVFINSVTDNVGDTWILNSQLQTGTHGYTLFVYTTNVITTTAVTLIITGNATPSANQCHFELFKASTGISLATSNGLNFIDYVGTGIQQVNTLIQTINTQSFQTPSNTLSFELSWTTYFSNAQETITFTQSNPLTQNTAQASCLTPCLFTESWYSFNTASVTNSYNVIWNVASTQSAFTYAMGLLVIIFKPYAQTSSTVNGNSCQGSNCSVTGGGSTLDTSSQFSLTANTTYWYYGTTGIGGLTIQNITSKIASYTNNAVGKALDTYELSIYRMPTGTNIQNYSTIGNPFSRIYNTNGSILTGSTNKWLHAGSINIAIPINTSYAISIISKFSGLRLYHTINPSSILLDSTEGTFSGATWSPPFKMTQTNTAPFLVFLEFFGYQNPIFTITTLTTVTHTSCVVGSTCSIFTSTIWQTQTSTINNLQGGGGAMAIMGNLIYYWPVWMLPMFMIPFGIQGILIGFIFGDIIGGISGIIPLWAAFILGLGTVYLLQRRF